MSATTRLIGNNKFDEEESFANFSKRPAYDRQMLDISCHSQHSFSKVWQSSVSGAHISKYSIAHTARQNLVSRVTEGSILGIVDFRFKDVRKSIAEAVYNDETDEQLRRCLTTNQRRIIEPKHLALIKEYIVESVEPLEKGLTARCVSAEISIQRERSNGFQEWHMDVSHLGDTGVRLVDVVAGGKTAIATQEDVLSLQEFYGYLEERRALARNKTISDRGHMLHQMEQQPHFLKEDRRIGFNPDSKLLLIRHVDRKDFKESIANGLIHSKFGVAGTLRIRGRFDLQRITSESEVGSSDASN